MTIHIDRETCDSERAQRSFSKRRAQQEVRREDRRRVVARCGMAIRSRRRGLASREWRGVATGFACRLRGRRSERSALTALRLPDEPVAAGLRTGDGSCTRTRIGGHCEPARQPDRRPVQLERHVSAHRKQLRQRRDTAASGSAAATGTGCASGALKRRFAARNRYRIGKPAMATMATMAGIYAVSRRWRPMPP